MMSHLTKILFGSLLDSPAAVEIASEVGRKAVSLIQKHFTFTAYEVTEAYRQSYGYALAAIRLGVAAPEPSLWQKIGYSKITREFAKQIEQQYWQPFVQQTAIDDEFRIQAAEKLHYFSKRTNQLGVIEEITEEDLAALISSQQRLAITDLLLQQMHAISPVDETLAAFLRHQDLLGHAVLFFFRELLRQDPRLAATQTALQQAQLCVEVQHLQATIDDLKTQQQKYPLLSEPIEQQLQCLQQWQTDHEPLLQFARRFESWQQDILAWANEVYVTLGDIGEEVTETKRLVENIARKLDQLLAQHGLSSQVSPRDEFMRYDDDSLQLIQTLTAQFDQLPSQQAGYGAMSIKLGCALSSNGELDSAERRFLAAVDHANDDEEKALAYYNLFQVRWRQAFSERLATQQPLYANALTALKKAIELSNGRLALHDIHKGYYPIQKLLGAGGMGCALLCENHNFTIQGHPLVVIKCFWENISGSLEQVFSEPMMMNNIAGDYVPKTLDFGYADNQNKKRAYFVCEYIDGAIDGEAWLDTQGPFNLMNGLQVAVQIADGLQKAHQKGILHLDLKPANLLLKKTAPNSVSVKIIDFGLARVTTSLQQLADSRSGLTTFGQAVFGTIEYAPPEQRGYGVRYGQPTAKSDIFAFGTTMYRLWTGNSPQHFRERDLPDISELRDLLFDCVTEEPTQRPESAQRLVERLKAIEAQLQKEQQAQRQAKAERLRQQQEAQRQAKEAKRLRKEQEAKRQAAEEAERLRKEQEAKRQAEKAERLQKEQEAKRQAAEEAERLRKEQAIEKQTQRQLSVFNPLDHLRLLWWILVMPEYLKDYQEVFGEWEPERVGSWLASTLVLLPLWMPTLALGLELLPTTAGAWSSDVYFWLSLALGGGWLLTGWFGTVYEDWAGVAVVVAVGVAVVAGGVAGGVTLSVAFVAGVVVGVVVGGMAGGMAGIVTGSVAGSVAAGAGHPAAGRSRRE